MTSLVLVKLPLKRGFLDVFCNFQRYHAVLHHVVVEALLKVTISELPKSSAIVSSSQRSLLSQDKESLCLVNAILLAAENLKSKSRLASAISDITRAFTPGVPTDPIPLPSLSKASKQPTPSTSQSINQQQMASNATVANASEFCVAPPDQLFDEVFIEHWDNLRTSLEDATTIHFIDTGGQPEFQEILPALLSGSCISMLLFKLHEELKQRYTKLNMLVERAQNQSRT